MSGFEPQTTARDTWLRFAEESGLPILDEAREAADLFAPELARYAELVQGPGGDPVGLMVRGEGDEFTDRARALMRDWRMPDEGIAHYLDLARLFEHRRAFLKLEWRSSDRRSQDAHGEQVERLVAFYFRRRPAVSDVLRYLGQRGVSSDVLEQIARLARLLDKGTIHFVSGALRTGHAVRHKLYFSQYLTPATWASALDRLRQAMEWCEVDQEARSLLETHHATLSPPERTETIFVSASFGSESLEPSVKIDYPEVPARAAVSLLPLAERPAALAEVQRLCRAAGTARLSYLGVRLHRSGAVGLKYYADFQPSYLSVQE